MLKLARNTAVTLRKSLAGYDLALYVHYKRPWHLPTVSPISQASYLLIHFDSHRMAFIISPEISLFHDSDRGPCCMLVGTDTEELFNFRADIALTSDCKRRVGEIRGQEIA